MTDTIRNSPQNQSPRNQHGSRRAPRLGTGIPSSENSFERRKRKSTPMPEQQAKRTKSCQISVKDKNSTTDSIGHNFNKKTEKKHRDTNSGCPGFSDREKASHPWQDTGGSRLLGIFDLLVGRPRRSHEIMRIFFSD